MASQLQAKKKALEAEEWHHHYLWRQDEAERLVPPLGKELERIQRLILGKLVECTKTE